MLAFYDDYGRGMDGMQLPYVTQCFRADVARPATADGAMARAVTRGSGDDPPADGPDDDMLLIDFR